MGLQTFLTRAFLIGLLIFFGFVIWGAGGGIKTIFNLGKISATVSGILVQIPGIVWLIIAGLILLKMMFGRK